MVISPQGFIGSQGGFGLEMYWNHYRNNSGGYVFMKGNNANNAYSIRMREAGLFFYANQVSTKNTTFSPTYRMVIRSDGNIGIGSNYIPTAKLDVNGSFKATSKNFVIDHPLDPENKDLVHGAIEAPRYDLIYRGQAELIDGMATVSIDAASGMTVGTFAALTQNPQVFIQNNDTWDLVRASVVDGNVIIESQNLDSAALVDWLVVAERADAYIMASEDTDEMGRLLVEQDKPVLSEEDRATILAEINEVQEAPLDQEVLQLTGTRGHARHPEAHGLLTPTRQSLESNQGEER